ncbi:hypothetical protein K502DRAFT_53341 [Neoconidiobolus thromboides FSU 785]|nr:hypothetical protein K502DRAFT_53341 [Neoconidiobolus thromboides FSU 785]
MDSSSNSYHKEEDHIKQEQIEGDEGYKEDLGEEEYEVEKIIKHRDTSRGKEYLIRWKGFSSKHDTWERKANIYDESLIETYWKNPYIKPKKKKVRKTETIILTKDEFCKDWESWEEEIDSIEDIKFDEIKNDYVYIILW